MQALSEMLEETRAAQKPLRLLFVDDDPILREFAQVHLATDWSSVRVAANGEEALAAMRQGGVDMILLDLSMPKMDGFAVLAALRGQAATKRLPIIVVTGRDDVGAVDRAFSAGATSFLVKPINWRLLAHQIRFVDRARLTEQSLIEHAEEVERTQRELETTSEELVRALRGTAAASETKAQFLAAMSHELRTPLNAIIGFSEILDAETFGPLGNARYHEYAHDIRNSGKHLLALINDVLELSRTSAGEVTLVEDDFAPAALIADAIRMMRPQAELASVALDSETEAGMPKLRGDRRRVLQVLLNLLSNAVKFTAPGGQVSLRCYRGGRCIAMSVKDTGIGIAAADIPRALERFTQIDSTLARKYEGTGLGLPLSKQFMQLHGGTLHIASEPGRGTTVTVTFPAERTISG